MATDDVTTEAAGRIARTWRESTPFAPALTPESLSPDSRTSTGTAATKKRSHPEDLMQLPNDKKRFLGSNMLQDAINNETIEARPVIDVTTTREARTKLVAGNDKETSKAKAKAWKDTFRPALAILGLSKRQIGPKSDNTWHSYGMQSGLHPHQVLGTAWMHQIETGDDGRVGGILASDMGLGKTITTLAMMVRNTAPKGSPRATLVVTRNEDLVKQWRAEIKKHVKEKNRKIILCFRGKMDQDVRSLERMNFIITTYADVLASYPKNDPPEEVRKAGGEQLRSWWEKRLKTKGVLHQCTFHRVVLDGFGRLLCIAVNLSMGIIGYTRLDELYPILRFIKAQDIDKHRTFKRKYCRDDDESRENLDGLLREVMHRITHGDKVLGSKPVNLPKTHQAIIHLDLDQVSKHIYQLLMDKYFVRVKSFDKLGTIGLKKKRKCVLLLLTKLRQFTADISLVKDDLADLLTTSDITHLRAIASSSADTGRLTMLVDYVERLILEPPRKAEDIHRHVVGHERSTTKVKHGASQYDRDNAMLDEAETTLQSVPHSVKVEAVLGLIDHWSSEAPEDKVIVFTEWFTMIAIIANACSQRRLGFRKYHGRMSSLGRSSALKAFREDSDVRVLIASTKCGGIGLNLTSANRMISIDAWWNACVEDQAFGRIYRMGQTREVHFTRFAIRDTIDEKLLAMQKKKSAQIDRAVRKSEKTDDLDDDTLMSLFGEYLSDDEKELFSADTVNPATRNSRSGDKGAVPQDNADEEGESCEESSESDSEASASCADSDTNSVAYELSDIDYDAVDAEYESESGE